jgi:hypothetical protein
MQQLTGTVHHTPCPNNCGKQIPVSHSTHITIRNFCSSVVRYSVKKEEHFPHIPIRKFRRDQVQSHI